MNNNNNIPQQLENGTEEVEDMDVKSENFSDIEDGTSGINRMLNPEMNLELESLHHSIDIKDDTLVNEFQVDQDYEPQICGQFKCKECGEIFTNMLELSGHTGCNNKSNREVVTSKSPFRTHTGDKQLERKEPVTVRNCDDVVDYLVNTLRFAKLSNEDKLYIRDLKRPCPDLSKTLVKVNAGKANRAFNSSWYDKHSWIVGSTTLVKIFCWPCVLFAKRFAGETAWIETGYDDIKNISRSSEKHSKSSEHIGSMCKFVLFNNRNISVSSSADGTKLENFNAGVRKNREIIKRLIEISVFLCQQDLPFGGHDETAGSFKQGNFEQLVLLCSKRDLFLKRFLKKDSDNKSVFSDSLKSIQNDLIDSIGLVLDKKIQEEILDSPFISWQVDEVTNLNFDPKLSVIFRYVVSGKIIERFMGFFDATPGRTADDLFELFTTFERYDLKSKLIGQTYDGAAVKTEELNALLSSIKSVAPRAIFTHCHEHKINKIISQACSSIQEVRVFFSTLSGFSAFFSKSPKQINVLNKVCGNLLRTKSSTPWNFTSRAVFTVKTYRDRLIDVFDFIIGSADFEQTAIREAVSLKCSLNDHKFIFFLETFTLIFEQTDEIFSIIQNNLTKPNSVKKNLQSLLSKLREFRSGYKFFNNIYDKLIIEESSKRRKNNELPFDKNQPLKQIFVEIFDTVIAQIEIRFSDLEKLNFLVLSDVSKFTRLTNFPHALVSGVVSQYKLSFLLKNELLVVYEDGFLGKSKSPTKMIQFMHDSGLEQCMPEFYKLLCLAVTLPIFPASDEESFSTLKRVQNYNRKSIGEDTSNHLCRIVIEKDLVKTYSGSDQFLEDVIDCFSQKTKCKIPLVYL